MSLHVKPVQSDVHLNKIGIDRPREDSNVYFNNDGSARSPILPSDSSSSTITAGMVGGNSSSVSLPASATNGFAGSQSVTPMPCAVGLASNRPADLSNSIYNICVNVRNRLATIPSINIYLQEAERLNLPSHAQMQHQFQTQSRPQSNRSSGSIESPIDAPNNPSTASTIFVPPMAGVPLSMGLDPLTLIWRFLRMGTSLCQLFRELRPDSLSTLTTSLSPTDDVKVAKKALYHFIQGCRMELHYSDDQLFTISDVFSENLSVLLKVVHTVSRLLDELEAQGKCGPVTPPKPTSTTTASDGNNASIVSRDRVVQELIITEQKYVQDLEVMMRYQREMQQMISAGAIAGDLSLEQLFGDVNDMVEFQRRFLVALEFQASFPPEQQRFGYVFQSAKLGLEMYENAAINQKQSVDVILNEAPRLQALAHIIEPTYELQAMLIKPVQRICKYPLLLRELIKFTPNDWPYYEELLSGCEVMKAITARVNETQRRIENIDKVHELNDRMRDWRGHNVSDFGDLLLDGVYPVVKTGFEREYHLYLFENIILCCKEAPTTKKSMGLSKKPKANSKRQSLVLKGRIYMAYVTDVFVSKKDGYLLHLSWGKDDASDTGFFDIRFRNDESLSQWENTIKRMVQRYHESSELFHNQIHDESILTQTVYDDDASDDEYDNNDLDQQQFDQQSQSTARNSNASEKAAYYQQQQQHQQQLIDDMASMIGNYQMNDPVTLTTASATPSTPQPYIASSPNTSISAANMSKFPPRLQARNRSASSPNYFGPVSTANSFVPPMPPLNNVPLSTPATRIKSEGAMRTANSGPPSSQYYDSNSSVMSSRSTATSYVSSSGMTTPTSMSSFSNLPSVVENGYLAGSHAMNATTMAANNIVGSISAPMPLSKPMANVPVMAPTTSNSAATSVHSSASTTTAKHMNQLKVKLHFLEDTFLLIVPSNIQYQQLVDRVDRKIRLCGKLTPSPLRIRYKDEDNDFVSITSDEDIQMALEQSSEENDSKFNDVLTIWVG